MPDDAALSPAIGVALFDALQQSLDNGDLLVPRDLLVRPVEQHVAPRETHESLGAAKRHQHFVERRDEAAILHQAGVALDVGREIGSDPFGFDIVEGPIDDIGGEAVGVLSLLPYAPKLPRRADRAVLRIVGCSPPPEAAR